MSYNSSLTGDIWCSQFKSYFGNINIIPGDHDTGGHNSANFGETHSYERYVNSCPLFGGVPIVCGPVAGDCYGREYYFDYPATNPLARFIFASPKIYNMTGVCTTSPDCSSQTGQPCTDQYGCWQYNANDTHYNWTSNAIDDARARGIGWVIVATHKLCISSADATCSMGIAFFNLLIQKKVDLIIQAHDNAYERSKQLALNGGTCPKIGTDGNGYAVYNSGCVVDNGTGNYTRGAGSVVVVNGAWIDDLYGVNASASTPANTAEAPFFAKLMGKNTPGAGLGFTKYTISEGRIDIQTSFSGTFSDSFSILNSPNPVQTSPWPALVANPGIGEKEFKFAWERSTFFAASLYWAFWVSAGTCEGQSGCLYYSSSADGVTWATPTNLGVHVNREDFSVTTDGTHAYYTRYNETSYFASTCNRALLFRQGSISGGSITWQKENVVIRGNLTTAFINPNLKLDSNGQAWIGYLYSSSATCGGSGTEQPRAIHSSGTNYGSWSSQTVLSTAHDGNWAVDITSLGNGAMYFTYWLDSSPTSATDLHGRVYNSTFFPDQPISSPSDKVDGNAFVFSSGAIVYAVWLDENLQRLVFASTTFKSPSTETWNPPVTIGKSECCSSSSGYGAQPWSASFDPATKTISMFWYNYTNQEVDLYHGLGNTWTGPVPYWSTSQATSVSSITSFQYASMVGANGAEAIGAMFMDGQAIGGSAHALKYVVDTTVLARSVSVNFVMSPNNPLIGQQITFTANATGATPPYSYNWNFGDGFTRSTSNTVVTHTYSNPGTFLVRLNSTDSAGVTGTSSRNVSVVASISFAPTTTQDGRIYKYFQNGTLSFVARPVSSALRQVAWKPDGSYALIVGDGGVVYTYDGQTLTSISSATIGKTNLNTVAWKPDGSYALIGGQNGLVFKYNGTVNKVTDPSSKNIFSISWNPNGNSALIVGDQGTALVYTEPSDITIVQSGTGQPLNTVSWNPSGTYALTAGGSGTVLLYNGASFNPLSTTGLTPSGKNIRFIAFNPISNLAVLVGDGGLVWSYDGKNLASLTSGTTNNLFSLSWIGGTGYIVGQNGTILSTSGTTVTKLSTIVTFNFLSIAWKPQPVSLTFTFAPSNPSTQSPISFTASASGGTPPYSFGWSFGDGSTATGASVVHSYSSSGSYIVAVTVTDNGGATNRTSSVVTVQPPAPPIVTVNSPTPNPASTNAAVSLSFTVSSGTSVTGIVVNWGDGTPADNLAGTATTDSHLYTSTGPHVSQTFTISVTATNAGGSGSGFTSETINDSPPTITISSVAPNPATIGQVVTANFNATDPDGNVASYTVNWGDGTSDSLSGTATSDSHTYASTGTFLVTVTGKDNSGSTNQATVSVVVSNPLTPPSVSVSGPSPNPVITGATVNVAFTVTSSSTVNGITVNWGDGSPVDNLAGTATSDTHVYSSTGPGMVQTFTITVTASNAAGSGSGSTSETVNDRPPSVLVSGISSPVRTGQLANLTFSATDPDGSVSSVSVNWGDGNVDLLSGTATSDTHIYTSTGGSTSKVFAVTVIATDNGGSSGQASSSVTVNDQPPTVNVTGASPNPALAGQTVTISFSTSDPDGTVSSVVVNWGDGSSPDQLPGTSTSDSHSYGSGGNFTITVTVTDNSGSSSTGTISERVNAPLAPSVTINSVSPNPAITGQTVTITFTVSSVPPVTGVTVNWGDGSADSLAGAATSDTHVYSSTGNTQTRAFTVVVTATSTAGSGSATTLVSITDQPPNITLTGVSPNPANTGVIVTASFSSSDIDGTVSSIMVSWGDGTAQDVLPGTASSDTHSYSSPGSYTITILVTDNSGSNAQTSGSVTVQAPVSPPTVTVSGPTPNPVSTGTTVSVSFTVSSSAPVTGITVSWGDGTTVDNLPGSSTGDTHVYSSTGAVQSQGFTITVSATNSGGTGSGTTIETVNDRSPSVAISSIAPSPALTGQIVTVGFSATDPDGAITSVTVNWGDGTVHNLAGTSTSDTHSYTTPGNFTVTISATDNAGSLGQASTTVGVKSAAAPLYALSTTSDGKVYKTFTNGTMVLVGQPVTSQLRSVSWKPDGSYALISGDAAVLLKYDGTQLTVIPTGVSTGLNFWGVSWKPDGSYALIAGTQGLLLKYDGVSVTTISPPNSVTLFAVSWNPSGTVALLVGKGGTALTYDGTIVRSLPSGTSFDLDAIGWNPNGQYALIGGLNGTVLRFDGTAISTINFAGIAGTNAIKSIAFNSQGTLALLVGDNGMVLSYNGSTLTKLASPVFNWLYAVTWGPNGTAYIEGNSGCLMTYTNGTLTKVAGVPSTSFRAMAWKPQ